MGDLGPSEPATSNFATHEVYNQAGDLCDYDAFNGDAALVEAVSAFNAEWADDKITRAG